MSSHASCIEMVKVAKVQLDFVKFLCVCPLDPPLCTGPQLCPLPLPLQLCSLSLSLLIASVFPAFGCAQISSYLCCSLGLRSISPLSFTTNVSVSLNAFSLFWIPRYLMGTSQFLCQSMGGQAYSCLGHNFPSTSEFLGTQQALQGLISETSGHL